MSELELADAIIRHSLELQRLSAHDEAEALAIMQQLEAELRQLLASQQLTEAGKREINELVKAAEKAISSRYNDISAAVDTRGIMLMVADRTVETLREVIPAASFPSAARIASLSSDILIDGAPSSAWWERQSEQTAFEFAREVRQGVLLNETQEQIVTRIVGRRGEPGIMDTARRHVRSLVHSSVMTAANQARLETYRKNSRHMRGLRWLATLDSHTCQQCAALDGSAWNLDGEPLDGTTVDFQLPPAHFACRCIASPLPKSLDAILGVSGIDARLESTRTRASKDGPTRSVRFDDFLKRQDRGFVEEMLGARRADLYLTGKITLRDLISGTGRPLSLSEIRAR